MTVGISLVNLANPWLNLLRGVVPSAPTGLWLALHVGDPGVSGTANQSVNTTRLALNLAAASNGSVVLTGTQPLWNMTATETLSHLSTWDSSTSGSGNFWFSAALSATRTVNNGDTFTLTSFGITLQPIAA